MVLATPIVLLAILLATIVVLFVVLIILLVRNQRRYGSLMPPRRANSRPQAPAAGTAPGAPSPSALPAPSAALPATAYLEQSTNGEPPQIFPLDRPVTTIGRDPACEIRIDERFVSVSRRHAQIAREEDMYVLSDLNSRSGVFVDGTRIGRNRMADGAVIQIGQDVQYTFHLNPARGAT